MTFLAEGGEFVPSRRIVEANEKLLLHYVFAEDHGWRFNLYEGQNQACLYDCSWNDEIKTTSRLDLTGLKKILKPEYRRLSLQEFAAKLQITEHSLSARKSCGIIRGNNRADKLSMAVIRLRRKEL